MKPGIDILVLIATLLFGTFGSVATATTTTTATADEVCYEHVVIGVYIVDNAFTWLMIGDAYGKGPFNARISVYDEAGNPVTLPARTNFQNAVGDLTIPLNGSYRTSKPYITGIRAENNDRYRHYHITTDEDAVVRAWTRIRGDNQGLYELSVHKRQLTNSKTWEAPCDPPGDKKS